MIAKAAALGTRNQAARLKADTASGTLLFLQQPGPMAKE
jgi:hypothetical protein